MLPFMAGMGASILDKFASAGIDKLFDDDELPGMDFGMDPMQQTQGINPPTSIPGPLQDFGKSLMEWGKAGGKQLGTSIMNRGTSALAEKLFTDSPEKAGAKEGAHKKAMMDAAFPGTTPWERLGSSAAGGSSIPSREAGEQARTTMNRQMQHQKEIVGMQIEGQKEVAEITTDPASRQAAVAEAKLPVELELTTEQANDLRNQIWSRSITTKFQQRLANAQTELTNAQTKVANKDKLLRIQQTLHEFEKRLQTRDARQIDRARAALAKEIVQADLDAEKFKNLYTTLNTLFDDGSGNIDWEKAGIAGALIAMGFLKTGGWVLGLKGKGLKKGGKFKGKKGSFLPKKGKDDAHLKFQKRSSIPNTRSLHRDN